MDRKDNVVSERRPVCILLVEDHRDTRNTLAMALRNAGYTVHAAMGVSEARAIAALNPCDLLLSDLGLLDGSGELLVAELKILYTLKSLAFSAYSLPTEVDAALYAGFDRFIAKPADFLVLLKAVQELTTHI